MHTFAKRFLAARDGDLSPFDSWRRKFNGKHVRFEACFIKPFEGLTGSDYEALLLVAAEAKATVAWLYAQYVCSLEEAIDIHVRHVRDYIEPNQNVLGSISGIWGRKVVSLQIPLFRMEHKPPEDQEYISAQELGGLLSGLGYVRR